MVTIVHALWGDEYVAKWPLSMRESQANLAAIVRPDVQQFVAAYGQQNYQWLTNCGGDPVLVSEEAVVNFDHATDRCVRDRDCFGQWNYGTTMWTHKVDAIRHAMDAGADEAIWLDWDVIYNGDQDGVLERLIDGQEFQGRLKWYRRAPTVYSGSCFYVRSRDILDEIFQLRDLHWNDETFMTEAITRRYFGGVQQPWATHREAGLDNPRLFDVRSNAVLSDEKSVFFKAGWTRTPPFPARECVA